MDYDIFTDTDICQLTNTLADILGIILVFFSGYLSNIVLLMIHMYQYLIHVVMCHKKTTCDIKTKKAFPISPNLTRTIPSLHSKPDAHNEIINI